MDSRVIEHGENSVCGMSGYMIVEGRTVSFQMCGDLAKVDMGKVIGCASLIGTHESYVDWMQSPTQTVCPYLHILLFIYPLWPS
jgi:hypothetical protein